MSKVIGLAVLMLLGVGLDAALACSVPRIRTFANQTVDGVMTARSGKPCTIRFRSSSGPMYTAAIVQGPSNGTARVGALHSIIYTSKPGFVGSDAFVYARHGRTTRNDSATRTVRVAVRVVPSRR